MALRRLGCDLGNFGVKVAQDDGTNFTFEARCEEFDAENYINAQTVLMYEPNTYLLNSGEFDNETIKANRSNLRECLVGALAMASNIKDKDRVLIGVGLPIIQYAKYKDDFREKLLKNNSVIKCGYGLQGSTIMKTIHIDDIQVFPEGVAAYWAMADKLLGRKAPMLIIVDIGGRTTDVCTIVRNLDGTTTPCNPDTIPYGTLKAYELIYKKFNSFSNNKGIPYTFTIEDVEPILYKGQILDERFDELDKEGYANLAYDRVAKHIARFVKESNPDYGKALVVITGGGASRFGTKVQSYFPDNSVVDGDIYSNAKGYLAALGSDVTTEE